MTEAEALDELKSMTAYDQAPTLTTAELQSLLDAAKRADAAGLAPDSYAAWGESTVYPEGTVIVPSERNGHSYIVTTAGTSGATEPDWSTTSGATVPDGTVIWTEHGAAWAPRWDLNRAAAAGWRKKAGKAAGNFDFAAVGGRYDRSQVVRACLQMVRAYAAKVTGSVSIEGQQS